MSFEDLDNLRLHYRGNIQLFHPFVYQHRDAVECLNLLLFRFNLAIDRAAKFTLIV